jgi:hypothetical protein
MSTSQIRASLYDQFGNPYTDETPVTFSTSMGSFWGSPRIVAIAREGHADATLTSELKTGIANVLAQVDGTADQIDVAFGPGPPYRMTLRASPAWPTVEQDTIIEAIVEDKYGNRVADGTRVRFETTLGALSHQDAETLAGMAETTLSSNAPGQASVTAQASQAMATVLVEFMSRMVLESISPESGCNERPVDLAIVGSGFGPGISSTLGNWALDTEWLDSTALRATVPQDIAAGVYDLTVTMPKGDWRTLPDAYAANNCGPIDPPLDGSYLGLIGAEPGFAPRQGDDDQLQVLFLEVPGDASSPLYIRLYDADCSGAHDIQNGKAWDTPFTFTVYGGPGAYTHPDARSAHPTEGAYTGTPLVSIRSTDILTDDQWYNLGPLVPSDGEWVDERRLFKLTIVSGPEPPFAPGVHFADVNVYGVAISTVGSQNIPPQGSRMFAFSWTFVISRGMADNSPRLYPYVGSSTNVLIQNNWDYDRFTENAGIRTVTPQRTINMPYDKVSGDNEEKSTAHDVRDAERDTTWAIRCWAEMRDGLDDNVVTFWVTDQDGRAVPMFARSTTASPP